MKAKLLFALALLGSISARAEIPAGLPTTLPDNATGYEEVTSLSQIHDGERYVIRAVFPTTSSAGTVFLTNVSETISDATQSVAEWKSESQISDVNTMVWTATTVTATNSGISNIIAFKNDGGYFSTQHNASIQTGVIAGGANNSAYNLVRGIYTVEEQSLYTGLVPVANTSTLSNLPDGVTSTFYFNCNTYNATSTTGTGTRLVTFFNATPSTFDFGAGSGSTSYTTTASAHYAIYRVVPKIPTDLPTTLPDGVIGYSTVQSASEIVAGKKYIITSVFPLTGPKTAILTNVATTISSASGSEDADSDEEDSESTTTEETTQMVAEWKTADEIEDVSSIIWTATEVTAGNSGISGIIALKNNDTYFSTRHNSSYEDQVIAGGDAGTAYNLVQGIYSQSEQTLNTGIQFLDHTTTLSNLASWNNGTLQIKCNSTETTGTSGLGTNLMNYYNSTRPGYDFGAGAGSTTFSTSASAFFTVYQVLEENTLADEVAAKKSTYTTYLDLFSSFNSDAVTSAKEKINALDIEEIGSIDEIVNQSKAIVAEALTTIFDGKIVTLQSKLSTRYLGVGTTAIKATADIAPRSYWKASVTTNAGATYGATVKFINYLSNYQLGSTSGASGSTLPISTANGVNFEILEGYATGTFALKNGALYANTNTSDGTINSAIYWTGLDNGSSWTIALSDEDSAITLAKADIEAATESAYTGTKTVGTGLNEYHSIFAATRQAFINYCATGTPTNDMIAEQYIATRDILDGDALEINQPTAGSYIRIKVGPTNTSGNFSSTATYLSSTNYSTTYAGYENDGTTATTIMYYTGEGLVAYNSGRYAKGASFLHFNTDSEGVAANSGVTVAFVDGNSAEVNTYGINFNKTRYLYAKAASDVDGLTGRTDAGSSVANTGYTFNLEYVSSLPVTIGTDGTASLCVPVAVTIPDAEACSFFVAKVDGTTLTLAPATAGTTYEAHTPIFVNGTAGETINFAIADESASVNGDYSNTAKFVANVDEQLYSAQEGVLTYLQTTATTAAAAPGLRKASAATSTATVTYQQVASTETSTTLPFNTPILNINESDVTSGSEALESFVLNLDPNLTESTEVELASVATNISEITAEGTNTDAQSVYDLQGRRVNADSTRRGIYIVNGRKVAL
jgi:hypothetical protein